MPALSPLTTRTRRKVPIDERLRSWDLDMQPGKPRILFQSHYSDSKKLGIIHHQIQEWIFQEEEEFDTTYFISDDDEENTGSETPFDGKSGNLDTNHTEVKLSHGDIVKKLREVSSHLSAYPPSILFTSYIEAFRQTESSNHGDNFRDSFAFLRNLRTHCQSDDLKKTSRHIERGERKTHRRHVEQINLLLKEHSCLQVVHLVLASTPNNDLSDNSFSKLKNHRNGFLKSLRHRNNAFFGTVGYLWRIYYHPQVGFRLLMVILLDPGQRKGDVDAIATEIGEFWFREITNKLGVALTLSYDREHRSENGDEKELSSSRSQVGKVCCDNPQDIRRLQSLLDYLSFLSVYGYYAPIPDDPDKKRRLPRSQSRGYGPWRRNTKP